MFRCTSVAVSNGAARRKPPEELTKWFVFLHIKRAKKEVFTLTRKLRCSHERSSKRGSYWHWNVDLKFGELRWDEEKLSMRDKRKKHQVIKVFRVHIKVTAFESRQAWSARVDPKSKFKVREKCRVKNSSLYVTSERVKKEKLFKVM